MKLYSVTNPAITASFRDGVNRGIPADGGLFLPVNIPTLPQGFLHDLRSYSFQETSYQLATLLLDGEIPASDLWQIVTEAMTFPVPLRFLDDSTSVLELFHGPTLAFKDVGARFMARTLAYLHRHDSRELTILVATSGDTGSAVASGFLKVNGMHVILLYPSGRVSTIQEMQLTTLGENVSALEIDGTFDDCQRLVKQAFADPELSSRKTLTSANSINIARLLPQAFYYFHAFAQLGNVTQPVVFSVPSGNLGNLTAGLIAARMGLPVHRFIAATNANKVVPHYLETGEFLPAPSVATISNAMDVGNPSNFARIGALYDGRVDAIRQTLYSTSCNDAETKQEIIETHKRVGYIFDPHGAVASLALRRYRALTPERVDGIVLATAHPAKFLDVYDDALKQAIQVPERLRACMQGTKRSVRLSSNFQDLKSYILTS